MTVSPSPVSAAMNRRRTIPPQTPRPTLPEVTSSPRLVALQAERAAEQSGAVEAFWAEVAAAGTPLIEPIVGDPSHRIVTFLWRDAGDTTDVLIAANKLTDPSVLAASLMERLPGTDIWHRSYRLRSDWRASYKLAPVRGQGGTPNPEATRMMARAIAAASPAVRPALELWYTCLAYARPDPLNPLLFRADLSVVELPDALAQPWWQTRIAVAAGQIETHRLASAILGNERTVWVYSPAGYHPTADPYGLLILLDGNDWMRLPVAPTLDNLMAAGVIPPLVVVMLDPIDFETRVTELACYRPFIDFLTTELLPWVSAHWRVTADPARTIVAGQSLGGLTAAFAGLRASERFGNVLSQSGSFWWANGSEFDVDAEWLTRQFALSARLPVRFYLEVGLQEWVLLGPTRHLRNVLDAHGYPLTYAEYNGGHDALCWRGGLADGLIALCQTW